LIFIETLGCPKNQADSRQIRGMLTERGFMFSEEPREAEIIIVNTCGFIDAAKQESIQKTLELSEFKKTGSCRLLIMFGCLTQKYGVELAGAMPEVDLFLGVFEWDMLTEYLDAYHSRGSRENAGSDPGEKVFAREPRARDYRTKWAVAYPQNHTEYIKIAEGCPRRCAFCVIPEIRGGYRSRARIEIIEEVSARVASGLKEAVLVAQDTGYYGKDMKERDSLAGLVRELCGIKGLEWIRLMYCYPEEVDEALMEAMNHPKVCPYLDIPVQHIDDGVLRRMGRTTSGADIKETIDRLRKNVPDIALRTTLMVGFPGESREAFSSLLDFIDEYHPERAGFFAFSPQPGTAAWRMSGQISGREKERRLSVALAKRDSILAASQGKLVGKTIDVMVDKVDIDPEGAGERSRRYEGRSVWDAPEIDGFVNFDSDREIAPGSVVRVRITHSDNYILTGEINHEFGQ